MTGNTLGIIAVCTSDFDLSPYFEIVKPTLNVNFNYKALQWDDAENLP
jgi:hypothetical protein